ncbi:magnesium transporter [Desertifilum sp. FACHB-1129]|uniref:Magnesium transporter MgtE n=1 Tax=Desertifilum tharense IPPAS B-1220 TaxID=1781255 RepID=A0A1E5QM00_9CYAN|nr:MULTISPECIES: magnesium transporter [Desertifilum]MDA0212974.1 magnesium transporter [Cyanobacteria bacterium FC1]MBD2312456.1 magnesium transporter [Desertifilum sp. FACHB-1129]MBD2323398.1 magnesium transporter [Desertifilum sp. FACHB-866]MBD2333243.1 magnesium transporter [Desertifilum sp. FACHB-868]OEJ75631.1 magnesium transporter [Desertifilum tharense IPPAS B-1220]
MRQNVLNDLLQPFALEAAKKEANRLPPVELVQLLMEIEPRKRVLAFRLLEKNKAIAVFEYLRPEDQAELVQDMESPEVMGLLEKMEPDDRVRLFDELPAKVTKRLIANLNPKDREAANLLLGYPEGSVGRIMNLRFLTVRSTATVAATLATVRESDLDANELAVVFLIDAERYYRGFVRTIGLIKADPDRPISDLVEGNSLAVRACDRDLKAAQLLKVNDLPAIPVVDNEGRLIGDITFDDVIDLVEEEATETILGQAGVGSLLTRDKGWSEKLVRGPAWYSIRLRILFLIVTLVGGFLVGGVIERFEETLEAVVAAAVFIPLVMDMGGNVGTQSSTIFARGLAWNQISPSQFMAYFWREIRIGFIMGLILGLVAGVAAYFWQGVPNGVPQLGLAVGVALTCVITLGAILGAVLPMTMLKLGFDHGPGADPFITTIKDFSGLWIYFTLVGLLIGVE